MRRWGGGAVESASHSACKGYTGFAFLRRWICVSILRRGPDPELLEEAESLCCSTFSLPLPINKACLTYHNISDASIASVKNR